MPIQIEDLKPKDNYAIGDNIINPTDAGGRRFNSFDANRDREKSSAESDMGENLAALGLSFRTLNGAANIWDWIEFDSYSALEGILGKEDKDFINNWGLDSQMSYLDNMQVGIKHLPRIAKATSQEGLALISKGIHQDEAIESYINEHTTKGWQTAGAISGAILDLDIIIPFSKVAKAKTILQNIAKPLSAQAVWEASHSMVNEDYTTSDAVLGFAGMSIFIGGMTRFQLSKMNSNVVKYSNTFSDVPFTSRASESMSPSNMNSLKFSPIKPSHAGKIIDDFLENYKWGKLDSKNIAKAGDDIEGFAYKDPDDAGIFNTQLGELIKKVTAPDIKTLDNMIEEVVSILENVKLGRGVAGATDIEKEVNGLLRVIRRESKESAFQLEDIVDIKMTKQTDGTYKLKTKNGKTFGKPITAAVALGLASTASLEAGENDSIVVSTIGTGLVLLAVAIGGGMAYKAWAKGGGTISQLVGRSKVTIDKSLNSVKVVTQNKAVGNIQKSGALLRTKLTETYQRFADYGGVAQEMADKLLVNFANGLVHSAEITKRRFARIAEVNVARVENDQFKEWLSAQGMGYHPVVNFVKNNEMLNKFRAEITDAIDGGTGAVIPSSHANIVAKAFKKEMKDLHQALVDAGVKGYATKTLKDGTVVPAIKYTENYVPRYWRTSDLRRMISAGGQDPKNRKLIHGAISEMAFSAAQKNYIKQLDAWVKAGSNPKTKPTITTMDEAQKAANQILKSAEGEVAGKRGRITDNSIARLEKQLADEGVDMSDDMRKLLELESDKTARAMYRIDLDYKAFKPFKIMENGKERLIYLDDMIDRDSHSIMSRYANEQGGNIALGKAGYPTVHAARTEAAKIIDTELNKDMNLVIDSLAGEDMVGMTARQKQRYEVMTGIAFVAKLPLVTVSMLTEYAKILTTKSGFHSLMNQISDGAMGTYPKHSMYMDELVNATGQGTASLRHEVNPKGLDDISNMTEHLESAFTGTTGKIANTVRQAKEGASRFYGLLRFSDFLQKHALVTNTQVISEMIYSGRKMSPTRMLQYGITQKILDNFKSSGLLKMDKDGWVNKLDWEKFTPAQKDEYINMTFRMNQNLTQETTLGGTALYMHNDYMFKSLSYLLTFPAEAFANHGIRDLTTMDNEAFRSMFAMYMGGYVSLKMRYALENKDVTDEEVAFRALISMPIFGAISTATGITDPVVLSFFNNMGEIARLSNYEDTFVGD